MHGLETARDFFGHLIKSKRRGSNLGSLFGSAEIWEGVADGLLRATGLDQPPQDAFALASCCGIDLRPWERSGGRLDGDVLFYPGAARLQRQHGVVAHELGHWALDWAREDQSEQGANYVGGALMLPRAGFDRDLRATAWNLDALRAKHLNCSAEMIARRIVELREAVVTIIDDGKVRARVYSPWLGTPTKLKRLTPIERDLVDGALGTGEVQRADDLLAAYPLIEGRWRRVIVVAEARQLSLRL